MDMDILIWIYLVDDPLTYDVGDHTLRARLNVSKFK